MKSASVHVRMSQCLGTITIVGKQVGAAVESTGDASTRAKRLDAVGDGSGSAEVLKRLQVDSKAGNVRGSHGSSGNGVGGRVAADPGRQDAHTGSEDIDTST